MQIQQTEREELINNNYGLVHACANRFRGRGVEYDDLFQAGCIGLMKAADHFEKSRGFAFSTYAVPVIFGEIKRIFRDGGSVKIGRTMKEKARKAMKTRDEMQNELGREPTVGELAEKMGVEVGQAAEWITASLPPISLTCGEEHEGEELEIPTDSPEEMLNEHMALFQVLNTLEERDKKLIRLRYFEGLTQSVTAAQLGMSQVQVSRREKVILKHLREHLC